MDGWTFNLLPFVFQTVGFVETGRETSGRFSAGHLALVCLVGDFVTDSIPWFKKKTLNHHVGKIFYYFCPTTEQANLSKQVRFFRRTSIAGVSTVTWLGVVQIVGNPPVGQPQLGSPLAIPI